MFQSLGSHSLSFILLLLLHSKLQSFRSFSANQIVLNSGLTLITDIELATLNCIESVIEPVSNLLGHDSRTMISTCNSQSDPQTEVEKEMELLFDRGGLFLDSRKVGRPFWHEITSRVILYLVFYLLKKSWSCQTLLLFCRQRFQNSKSQTVEENIIENFYSNLLTRLDAFLELSEGVVEAHICVTNLFVAFREGVIWILV